MNGRAIIIAVLILFKVIGIASKAKAHWDNTDWCGKKYYNKNCYFEQQIK